MSLGQAGAAIGAHDVVERNHAQQLLHVGAMHDRQAAAIRRSGARPCPADDRDADKVCARRARAPAAASESAIISSSWARAIPDQSSPPMPTTKNSCAEPCTCSCASGQRHVAGKNLSQRRTHGILHAQQWDLALFFERGQVKAVLSREQIEDRRRLKSSRDEIRDSVREDDGNDNAVVAADLQDHEHRGHGRAQNAGKERAHADQRIRSHRNGEVRNESGARPCRPRRRSWRP